MKSYPSTIVHSFVVFSYSFFHRYRMKAVTDLVVPSAMSLRSAIARNALLCIGELAECLKGSIAKIQKPFLGIAHIYILSI